MGWRVDAGNGAGGLPKPFSHFGTCSERESSVSWCLASPDLVATEDTEGKEEAVKDTGVPQIRKHDDE
jgi:hypothetical protein